MVAGVVAPAARGDNVANPRNRHVHHHVRCADFPASRGLERARGRRTVTVHRAMPWRIPASRGSARCITSSFPATITSI